MFQYIDAKGAFCGLQILPKCVSGRGSAQDQQRRICITMLPQDLQSAGESALSYSILPPSALDTKTLRLRRLSLAGGNASKYFPVEQRVMEHLTLLILYY